MTERDDIDSGSPGAPSARRRGGRAARLADARPASTTDASPALSDRSLTEDGLAAALHDGRGEGRLLALACGAIAREILALQRLNGWERLDLACLPALLHNRPEQIAPRLAEMTRRARAQGYDRILIGYGDCGSGGAIDALCETEGLERLPGAHCYAFFDGVAAFAERSETELTAFFLTDFLARQFNAIVWRGLGLDRHPDLRDVYFQNYDRVVFLAQTEDPALDAAAREAAERLGLSYERRATGYGDLAAALESAYRSLPET